jgi:hypothetical protein
MVCACDKRAKEDTLAKYLERGEDEDQYKTLNLLKDQQGHLRKAGEQDRIVNCCMKKKVLTMHIDAVYRGVAQNAFTL